MKTAPITDKTEKMIKDLLKEYPDFKNVEDILEEAVVCFAHYLLRIEYF